MSSFCHGDESPHAVRCACIHNGGRCCQPSHLCKCTPELDNLRACAMPFVYKILFVDDEERLRITTKAILESQGYDVLGAKDGLDGLAALQEWHPDLIISDLHMPNMNGFEFLSLVRQRFPN